MLNNMEIPPSLKDVGPGWHICNRHSILFVSNDLSNEAIQSRRWVTETLTAPFKTIAYGEEFESC